MECCCTPMKEQRKTNKMQKKHKIRLIWPFNMHAKKNPELFPIGLGFLLDNINKEVFDADLLDCSIRELHPESEAFENAIASQNTHLFGISWWSNNTPMVEKTIEAIKRIKPDALIAVGGPHPSAYGKELMFSKTADFVFYGEAEIGFVKLLEVLQSNGFTRPEANELALIEGLFYIDEKNTLRKNPQSLEKDLDKLGTLDYSYLALSKYQEKGYSYGGKVVHSNQLTAPMVATRGCPYKCNFCAAPAMNGRQLRRHSVGYILKEIQSLYYNHDVRHIAFVDDNFTLNTKWALKVCEAIAELELDDLIISTPNGIRLTRMNPELARAMRRAGWRELVLAPETGSPKTILEMDKDLDLSVVPGVVDMLHEADLKVAAFFIIGYPSETTEDLHLTEKFIHENAFDEIYLHIFQPLPGTPIFDRLVKSGDIDRSFVPGSYQQVTFKPRNLSKDEVQTTYNRIAYDFQKRKGRDPGAKTKAVVRQGERQLYGDETYS